MPMKKAVVLSLFTVGASWFAHAQDLKSVEKFMILQNYKEAKTQIDKVMADPKFNTKPESWIMKSVIYSGYANNDKTISKADSATFRTESFNALRKYSELDPTNALAIDPKYSDVSRQLYVAYFNNGINKFNDKDWQAAFDNLKNATILSDYLIKGKVLPGPIDTNAIMYTGASAQNLKKDEDAVTYFTRLADAKVAGKDNEFLYQFLTNYYLQKRDEANFKKYEQLGKQLYPSSKYFSAIGSDYARSSSDFNDVIKFHEAKIAAEPNNYDLNYDLGAEIYDHLYPRDSAKIPKEDVSAWEQKMLTAFEKASQINAAKGMPIVVIGNHFIKKAERINDSINNVTAEIKNASRGAKPDKTGKLPPAPKELTSKRAEMYQRYYNMLDQVVVYFEKAGNAFAQQPTLEPIEKQFYKNAASNLIDIYSMKATNAKGKPADVAKFTAAQKKWESTYDKIK
jgi:hypothetical protein